MIPRRAPAFKESYRNLPSHIQEKVKKAFVLFQQNPAHPSLQVKKLKGYEGIWEGRIDQFYRFTFEYREDPQTGESICVFRNVGRHDILDHNP